MIRQFYNKVELRADVIFINNVLFLTSISKHIHFDTANTVDNLKCTTLKTQLKNVVRCYAIRGFKIVIILVDPQFKALKDRNLVGVPFNVSSREEYVYNIER